MLPQWGVAKGSFSQSCAYERDAGYGSTFVPAVDEHRFL